MRPDKDTYFMNLATAIGARATCKRHHIGAIIVDKEGRSVSTGYNGSPRGLAHCLDVGCMRDLRGISSGRDHQMCRGLHAEQNALLQSPDRDKLIGATIYCNYSPCVICAKMIINVGIVRIVYQNKYEDPLADELLKESGIIISTIAVCGHSEICACSSVG